jgi:hypothetical protein
VITKPGRDEILLAKVGKELRYQIEAYDPEGQALTYIKRSYPFGLEVDQKTGLITWVPSEIYLGVKFQVTFSVLDGVHSISHAFYIEVLPPDTTPVPKPTPTPTPTKILTAKSTLTLTPRPTSTPTRASISVPTSTPAPTPQPTQTPSLALNQERGWFLNPEDTLVVYYYPGGRSSTVAWENNWFYWWYNQPLTTINIYYAPGPSGPWSWLYIDSVAPYYRSLPLFISRGAYKFVIKNYTKGDMVYLKVY